MYTFWQVRSINRTMTEMLTGLARLLLDVCSWVFRVQSWADNAGLDATPAVGRRSKAAWRGAADIGRWQPNAFWLVIAAALVGCGVWSFLYWLRSV